MPAESAIDVAILQNPDRMATMFQEYLRPADGKSIAVRSCENTYVRQSPARVVVQYTLEISKNGTGEISSHIVTGVTYGAERTREQLAHILQTDPLARRPIGLLQLPPITYVPDFDLLVQVFPFDYRLPGLLRLTEGTPELVAILFADVEHGNWTVERWDAQTVRYRPDMRAMVRVELTARKVGTEQFAFRRAYAKVYRDKDEGRQAFRLLSAIRDETSGDDAAFTVARPIAFIDKLHTLLLAEASGVRLLDLVRRSERDEVVAAVRHAARAVVGMHQVCLPDGLLPPARLDKREQLIDVASRLARNNPDQAQEIDELVAAIGMTLIETPLAPTHFDLKQGHILLDGDRLTILDFDKMALGDPLSDVANLVASLGAERQGNRSRIDRRMEIAKAFVDEYFAHVPDAWRTRFPAHFAAAALIEAGTTGRGQRGRLGQDNHPERVVSAIAQAKQALAGDLW